MIPMTTAERLVPKIHPLARAVEPDDPMILHATGVMGDPEEMVRSLIEEFAWMDWEAEAILKLFRDPFYPVLHALWRAYGEAGIQARIDRIVYAEEVSRFRTTIQEESEPGEEEPELIELALPPHWRSTPGSARPEGSSNAASL